MDAKVSGKIIDVGENKHAVVNVKWMKNGKEVMSTAVGKGATEEQAKQDLMSKVPGLAGVMVDAIQEFTEGTPPADPNAAPGAITGAAANTDEEKLNNLLGLLKQGEDEAGDKYRTRLFGLVDSMELEGVKKSGKTEELVVAMEEAIKAKCGVKVEDGEGGKTDF